MASKKAGLSPVNSRKHYFHVTQGTVGLGAVAQLAQITAVVAPDANLSWEVREGAEIHQVYVEFWITSDDAAQGSFILTVEKVPSAAPAMTYANSIALTDYPNKKNILYTTMGLNNPTTGPATPVIRQWVAIPKGKRRMGLGDKIVVNLSGITNGVNYCGFLLFKEFY